MSRAAVDEVRAGFVKTKCAIHRVANFVCVIVFLPIVFPPADGTERHRARSFKRLESAAWAAITLFRCSHLRMDENRGAHVYFGCRMSISEQGFTVGAAGRDVSETKDNARREARMCSATG
jgi:hypothetical protein